jgi:hypothetical protein
VRLLASGPTSRCHASWLVMSRPLACCQFIVSCVLLQSDNRSMATMKASPPCFACEERPAGNGYSGIYSAYCGCCQVKVTRLQPRGAECWCAACGRMFTSISAFDLHQRLKEGRGACLNPAEALRRNGERLFHAYRERDGMKIWGLWNPQSNPWTGKGREAA